MNHQLSPSPREIGDEPQSFASASLDTPEQPLPESASPSLTYEPFYGLQEKPFSLSSDPRFLYRSPTHTPAFEELLNGIRRREGLIVLTGEIGTGKTTLIRSVLQHLDRRTFTAFVPDPFVSREDLLKVLLVDFGVVSVADLKRGSLVGASRPELSYPLYEFLDSLVPLQAFAVLIIDEAQNLPPALLEEIRVLSDLEQREKLLQVVLVGQPELRSNLKLPEMRQVDQRVSVRSELSPLDHDDVGHYIRHRLAVASNDECRVTFAAAAVESIFDRSGGVPRLINLICDRALHHGHEAGVFTIEASHIEKAISDLGLRLRAPVATATAISSDSRTPDRVADTVVHVRVRPERIVAPRPAEPIVAVHLAPDQQQFFADFAPESESTVPASAPVSNGAAVLEPKSTPAPAPSAAPVPGWASQPPADGSGHSSTMTRVGLLVAAAVVATGLVFLAARAIDLGNLLPPAPAWLRMASPRAPAPALDNAVTTPPADGTVSVEQPGSATPFSIQVASFESRARADRLAQQLTGLGLRPRIVEFDLGAPLGGVLQVRIDGYATADDADRDLARIRELPGYDDARLLAK